MKSANLARLSGLMALARRSAELRLATLRAELARTEARQAELQAAMAAPLRTEALDVAGGLTAELDWRRGLAGWIEAEKGRIAELTSAADAARDELHKAFGRERAAHRLAGTAIAAEARQVARRAEGLIQPRRPARLV